MVWKAFSETAVLSRRVTAPGEDGRALARGTRSPLWGCWTSPGLICLPPARTGSRQCYRAVRGPQCLFKKSALSSGLQFKGQRCLSCPARYGGLCDTAVTRHPSVRGLSEGRRELPCAVGSSEPWAASFLGCKCRFVTRVRALLPVCPASGNVAPVAFCTS